MTDLLEAAIESLRSQRHARRRLGRVLNGSIGHLWDYRIVLDPLVADGTVFIFKHYWTITVGTRPLTPVERAGWDARRIVRDGLADVLEWLGEDVGPERPPTHRQILDVLGVER